MISLLLSLLLLELTLLFCIRCVILGGGDDTTECLRREDFLSHVILMTPRPAELSQSGEGKGGGSILLNLKSGQERSDSVPHTALSIYWQCR